MQKLITPILLFGCLITDHAQAASLRIVDTAGAPVKLAMVTRMPAETPQRDTSDGGYQAPGKPVVVATDLTIFTGDEGEASFDPAAANPDVRYKYRVRKHGYRDAVTEASADIETLSIVLEAETDPVQLAAAKPANVWLGAIDFDTPKDKQHFQMQCGFCHQLGTSFMRRERSPEEWEEVIDRMVRYGSRLPSDLQKRMPEKLTAEWRRINASPEKLAPAPTFSPSLTNLRITEWPLGDGMSQMHDMLIAESGLVYVADNIQDRLYEVDVSTNAVTVYKIPHREGEKNGGLIAGRLEDFARHDSTSNAHSLAESKRDGHIFITPSAQRRLVEFNPETKAFTLHEMDSGFYPHTIRVDSQDRVWFTLALSNQIAMFDRTTAKFTLYDLPARNFY